MMRIVVLLSGTGTLFEALADHLAEQAASGRASAQIVAVGADRPQAGGLDRARERGIDTFCLPLPREGDRARWDQQLCDLVDGFAPDLVVSAGFMKLLGPAFLDRFGGRTINTHPALLPSFPGMHGPRDALAHGVKVSGATVFMVDAGLDTGAILAQGAVPVLADDDESSLHERIKVVERQLLVEVVDQLAEQHDPRTRTIHSPVATQPSDHPSQEDPR